VKADEALAIGLVDRVVPAAELHDAALAWASESPVGRCSRWVWPSVAAIDAASTARSRAASNIRSRRVRRRSSETDDAATASASFLEHGPGQAAFKGR